MTREKLRTQRPPTQIAEARRRQGSRMRIDPWHWLPDGRPGWCDGLPMEGACAICRTKVSVNLGERTICPVCAPAVSTIKSLISSGAIPYHPNTPTPPGYAQANEEDAAAALEKQGATKQDASEAAALLVGGAEFILPGRVVRGAVGDTDAGDAFGIAQALIARDIGLEDDDATNALAEGVHVSTWGWLVNAESFTSYSRDEDGETLCYHESGGGEPTWAYYRRILGIGHQRRAATPDRIRRATNRLRHKLDAHRKMVTEAPHLLPRFYMPGNFLMGQPDHRGRRSIMTGPLEEWRPEVLRTQQRERERREERARASLAAMEARGERPLIVGAGQRKFLPSRRSAA